MKTAAGALAALAAIRYAWRRRRAIELSGASVLISGGSRGLGLELAREFSRRGARIAILARDEDELERARADLQLDGADVLIWKCDVRDPNEVETAVGRVLDIRGRIDVLVNVAGVIQVAPIEHLDAEDFEESFGVHVKGPLHLSRAVIPSMTHGGRIVNISSIGGLVPIPHMLPYVASKFALTGLSSGMRIELVRRGIFVTTVCPGLMRTGSHVNARFKGQHEEEFTWFSLSAALPLLSTTSGRAARRIVEACRFGDAFLIITPQARLLHLFHAVAPGAFATLASLTSQMLPDSDPLHGDEERPGWASRSAWAPSILTRFADRVIRRNNELTKEGAERYFADS